MSLHHLHEGVTMFNPCLLRATISTMSGVPRGLTVLTGDNCQAGQCDQLAGEGRVAGFFRGFGSFGAFG